MRIVFVIDAGKYEWQSVLLAASARLYASGCTGLTACVPGPRRTLISESVLAHHVAQGVEIVEIGDVADHFSPRYDHGNKILAAAAMAGRGSALFMDSDTVFVKDTHLPDLLDGRTLSGARATGPAWPITDPAAWHRAHSAAGLPPADPIHLNAGVIAWSAELELGPRWLEIARAIDASGLPNLRPWLDQVALGTLAASLPTGSVNRLDKTYNYSIVHDPNRVPIVPHILHYHGGNRLQKLRRSLGPRAVNHILRGLPVFGDIDALARLADETDARHHALKSNDQINQV